MSACTVGTALAQLQEEIGNCEKALVELIKVKKIMPENLAGTSQTNIQLRRTPIAIIGMGSIFLEF